MTPKELTFESQREAALYWYSAGLNVVPISLTTTTALVEKGAWLEGLSIEKIYNHFTKNPTHEVGAILGRDTLAITVNSDKTTGALPRVLWSLNPPSMTVMSGETALCLYSLPADESSQLASLLVHTDILEAKSGGEIIGLPSIKGCSMKGVAHMSEMEPLHPENIEAFRQLLVPAASSATAKASNPLAKFSLLGSSDQLEQRAMHQKPLLGEVCLSGEATVWYAKHGTGKTLIMLSLLIETVQQKRIDPNNVIYVDVDDSSAGLAEKVRLLEEFGVHVLAQDHNGFKARDLMTILNGMIERDEARGLFLILDTLKKFVSLMDKSQSSAFAEVVRRFVMAGGTLLGLAHTNKKHGADGKPVYGGTSDIVDDFDCSYILSTISSTNDRDCVVEFECNKSRGNSVPNVAYGYSLERGITYLERVASVYQVENDRFEGLSKAAAQRSDAVLIETIAACILEGFNTKMFLASVAAERTGASKQSALKVIEKYSGNDPNAHHWRFTVRARGAKVFELLDR